MEAILNDNGKRVDNMKWGGGSDKSLIDMTKKVTVSVSVSAGKHFCVPAAKR